MRILSMAAALLLGGCAALDTGAVDFRRAENLTIQQQTDFRTAFLKACTFRRGGDTNSTCDPMLPTRLVDKFFPTPADFISTGDVFSIRLDYGVIKEMTEWKLPSFRSEVAYRKNGEIAVLVNAFEMSDKSGDTVNRFFDYGNRRPDANDPSKQVDDFADARVVYFSPDVDEGQALNLSNIPIIGPMEYHGRPIGLQILVIELDELSPATSSLLKSLADLGKTYVGGGGITDTLFALGKSLLDGSQDDIIFEYRMMMDNGAYTGTYPVSAFQSGRMVFRRAQNRSNSFIWRNTVLDQNTGALFAATAGDQQTESALKANGKDHQDTDFVAFTQETYFTINVINHGPDGPVGNYEHKTWSEVSAAFDAYVANTDAPLDAATAELKKMIEKRRSLNSSKTTGDKIDGALDRWRKFGFMMIDPNKPASALDGWAQLSVADQAVCTTSLQQLVAKAADAPKERAYARSMTLEVLEMLAEDTLVNTTTKESVMRTSEFDLAVRRLWHGAVARFGLDLTTQTGSEANFQTGAAFKAAYMGDAANYEKLQSLFEGYAKTLEPKTCGEVNARVQR